MFNPNHFIPLISNPRLQSVNVGGVPVTNGARGVLPRIVDFLRRNIWPTCDFGYPIFWNGHEHEGERPRIETPDTSGVNFFITAEQMLECFRKLKFVHRDNNGRVWHTSFDYLRDGDLLQVWDLGYIPRIQNHAQRNEADFRSYFEGRGVPSDQIPSYRRLMDNMLSYLTTRVLGKSGLEIAENWIFHLSRYGIDTKECFIIFIALMLQETGGGNWLSEQVAPGNARYFERGGGYMQLTWESTQRNFFLDNDPLMARGYTEQMVDNIVDFAFYLGTYHPVESACFAWIRGNAIGSNISDIVKLGVANGTDMRQIFYTAAACINGGLVTEGAERRVTDYPIYTPESMRPHQVPNNWTDRRLTYNAAIDVLAPSEYLKFNCEDLR